MNRLLLFLACVLLPFSFALSADTAKPNIVVIYTDDQGYGDAGCYNPQSKIPTPNIDRLAAEGMRFTDGHCSDTVCTPSRYGLLKPSVSDALACQTDLLATLAELLGQPLPPDAGEDSVSFLGALTGRSMPPRAPMIHHAANGRFAIREGKWKLAMEHGRNQRELYDLMADPGEKNNVIAQHVEIATDLLGKITAIVQNGRSSSGEPQANDTGWWSDLAWLPEAGNTDPPTYRQPVRPKKKRKKPQAGNS